MREEKHVLLCLKDIIRPMNHTRLAATTEESRWVLIYPRIGLENMFRVASGVAEVKSNQPFRLFQQRWAPSL